MGTHKGSEGFVKVGSATIAEVKSYSLEESADTIETTKMGDAARSYLPSLTSFSGSVDCFCQVAQSQPTLFSETNNPQTCIERFAS